MDSDDSDDEKEPAVKHSQKVPKTQGFVDIDPSTSLLLSAVKSPQKTPKTRDEDHQIRLKGQCTKNRPYQQKNLLLLAVLTSSHLA